VFSCSFHNDLADCFVASVEDVIETLLQYDVLSDEKVRKDIDGISIENLLILL